MTLPLGYAQDFAFETPDDSLECQRWADSVIKTMTPDERLGQLFMVELSSKWTADNKSFEEVENYVKNYHVGGVIFFYGGPLRQAVLTNRLQSVSKIPLMVAIDGEWGLAMRLDSTVSFPKNLTLGAVENNELIYEVGREIGRQCNRLGINVDFMPSVDLYDNPLNTVIANRSFGSNKVNVALKASAIVSGMSDYKVLTTAKHFPGHGNTNVDSHEALPVISDSREKIDTAALYPFKYLINNGVGGVMVGHLFIPAFDKGQEKTPSSISKNIINELLIKKLNFNGLIFTDALKMKGISANFPAGEAEVRAFEAGVDVFLMPENCKTGFQAMKNALKTGRISQNEIDRRCKKILFAKKRMGLDKFSPVKTENLYEDLNPVYAEKLIEKLYLNAVTLIKNDSSLLPLRGGEGVKIAAVSVANDTNSTVFEKTLQQFTNLTLFGISKNAKKENFEVLTEKLKAFDVVVIGLHNLSQYPKNFGLNENVINFIDKVSENQKVVLNIFNSPLTVNKLTNYKKISSIVISYEDKPQAQKISAYTVFGVLPFLGKLPVDVNAEFKEGKSLKTQYSKL